MRVIGHRGGKFPGVLENTAEAARLARRSGATVIEIDLQTSPSGDTVLVSHDTSCRNRPIPPPDVISSLSRSSASLLSPSDDSGGEGNRLGRWWGRVARPAEEESRSPADEERQRAETLQQFLTAFYDGPSDVGVPIYLDVKDHRVSPLLRNELTPWILENPRRAFWGASFDPRIVFELSPLLQAGDDGNSKSESPAVLRRLGSIVCTLDAAEREARKQPRLDFVSIDVAFLRLPQDLRRLQNLQVRSRRHDGNRGRKGVAVFLWTVNERCWIPEPMVWQPDGVVTDFPAQWSS